MKALHYFLFFTHSHAASIIILLLPKATFSPSIQPPLTCPPLTFTINTLQGIRYSSILSSDHEHFVSWNQTHSPSLNLNIGVPQGSICRHLLFLIFQQYILSISIIHNLINSSNILLIKLLYIDSSNILSSILFADDTTVYVQHDSIDSAIQILNTELGKESEF